MAPDGDLQDVPRPDLVVAALLGAGRHGQEEHHETQNGQALGQGRRSRGNAGPGNLDHGHVALHRGEVTATIVPKA